MPETKFDFSPEFQFEILRFTALDKNGQKLLSLYDDSYFTLMEHAVIAHTFKQYYRKNKTIPGKSVLIEEINRTFNSKEFVNNLTDEDHKEILSLVKVKLYKTPLRDGTEILKSTERFAQFVDLKSEIEGINLLDFDNYETFARKVQKAISPRLRRIEEKGSFLIKDIRYRQFKRKDYNPIVPTPFKQINNLTNAGGYTRGSILVILDLAKRFKTGALVNIAIGYLKMFNVLVIDLDNGEDEFMIRIEQSIMGKTKREILSGDYDKQIQRSFRRRKRLGRELVIKKMPALTTTTADISKYMDYLYTDYNFSPHILIIDYLSKMGCLSGKDSLHERVGEAYIDVGNLALEKNIIHVWTGAHVKADGEKRSKTKYKATDIAGAIDISRHVQAVFGLNRSELEEQKGYQRMEIVEQRDGKPNGRAIFKYDRDVQRMTELVKGELSEYYELFDIESIVDSDLIDDNSYNGNRKRKSNDLS